MTLLHVILHRDRAFVAGDTTAYRPHDSGADVVRWPDGEAVSVAKGRVFANLGAVLLAAGRIGEHARQIVDGAHSFEHAVQRLHELLPSFVVGPGSYLGEPLRQFVALVGPSRDGMAAVQFRSEAGYRPEWTLPARGGCACLCTPAPVRDLPAPTDLDSMAAFARAAIEQARAMNAGAPYGGTLVVAQINLDGSILMRRAGDLGMPPRRIGADDLVFLPWQHERPPVPSVEQLLYGVATETYADEDGSGSASVGGGGGSSFVTTVTRSYTNDTGRRVKVQFNAMVFGLYVSSGVLSPPDDYVGAQWVWSVDSTPIATDVIYTSEGNTPPNSTSRVSQMVGWEYALEPGETGQIDLRGFIVTDVTAGTCSWERMRLRTTIIKA
ncbi:MAG: hypothetical protein JNL85_09855 [Rubrivivax sp.]|nr:hypothetical protein [Rubrivivax sp.]